VLQFQKFCMHFDMEDTPEDCFQSACHAEQLLQRMNAFFARQQVLVFLIEFHFQVKSEFDQTII